MDSDLAPGRWPGLLIQWRRTDRGWLGRVVVTLTDDAGPLVVDAWLPAGQLRPIGI